jgi:hypothetical protein
MGAGAYHALVLLALLRHGRFNIASEIQVKQAA